MRVDDCYQLGYVIKTHGLKGEVLLFLDVDDPSEYTELESMFVMQKQTLIPFFLEYIQVSAKKAIAKIEDIDSIDSASELVSCEVYLPLNNLPELKNGQYYFHQLVGMKMIEDGKEIGKVLQVYEASAQNLISVDHQGKEVLVPILDEIIQKVDQGKKEVHVTLPEGLLDIYLEEDEN